MSEYPDRKAHEALVNELCDLFDWSDRSALHALMHVTNAVLGLRADLTVERERREKAEDRLAGYQSAPVHIAATVLKGRLRKTAQILIEAVGADGPMDAEDAARKAVEVIEHHRECMRQAGLQAFMRGRSPGEVGDHLHGVLQSYTDKIANCEEQIEDLIEASLEWAGRHDGRERGE